MPCITFAKEEPMKRRITLVALVAASVGVGFAALAAKPAPPPPQHCRFAVCAACEPGYHLNGVWPDCCVCVPD
jgi:hypothetical protein